MQELQLFDCNASIGPHGIKLPHSFHTKAELLERMERYGIASALVHHAYAREINPLDGNARLEEELRGETRLFPLWVVMPHHTDEFYKPAELIAVMRQKNIRAVTMFPEGAGFGFSMSGWNSGELLLALEEHRVPLFIKLSAFGGSFDALHMFLTDYAKLSVVLGGISYRCSRNLFPLLKQFENLYVESFGYKQHEGIEDFCARFGAGRMLFGSGMPTASGAAAVAMITYADITREEKDMIAAGNLKRLLEGAKL